MEGLPVRWSLSMLVKNGLPVINHKLHLLVDIEHVHFFIRVIYRRRGVPAAFPYVCEDIFRRLMPSPVQSVTYELPSHLFHKVCN